MSRRSKTMQLVGVRDSRLTERPVQKPDQEQAQKSRLVASAGPVPDGTNIVILRGKLSRAPEHRALSSGSVLLTADITVRPVDAQADTVPVVWFDPPERALRFDEGDDVVAVGRVRRRFFRSGGATLSRTEVVVSSIVSARAPTRLRAAIAAALEPITPLE
ncbi:MAG: hypothetical protein F2520_05225 [Actinobacteria bacterium]|uniref:Unannotated protein n=1 Tax=freshwater metagenome TaxID=449393 RepID=A0A6J5YFQ9_9ZZZZ|nr:hypothetical protein [Actinomycetota bacterium]MTA77644.1 hypothetical protein [Actinomycetota bacterium]